MALRTFPGSGDPRYVPNPQGTVIGVAGRASISSKDLYSRTRSRSLRRPAPSSGCGWYEYGLYDVALELTEVPLRPFELEYRERTILSPEEPQPVELPSNRQPAVLVKLKHKPRACAPPHPSTVRLRYEPEAAPLVFPGESQEKNQKADKIEKLPSTQLDKDSEPGNASKDRHKTEKADKHDKGEKGEKKAEKGEKHDKTDKGTKEKEKSEKKDKEKKNKSPTQEQSSKTEA
ncbi:hypothetical protein, conserved [Eimeria brunetti]|uniref:Uncharacterized protein n=1 Tax=Eimeria brunetti TaxID=51314 RepID=U6LT13_9EIME|nr:hypothetical protein, conserved [Eimeria brunetti]